MEGVVAGVPSLADYDVIIDAGGDACDPENAVPFDVKTPAGKVFKQPGNYNFLIETSLFGTEPKFAAKGVKPDLDGDGKVEFGEALPDADFFQAAAQRLRRAGRRARRLGPQVAADRLQDALTALVVMTPTMSEYFEAWKNSRFVSGDKATETAFVVASRLQDIEDILGGLVLVYDNVETTHREDRPAQAEADRLVADEAPRLRGRPARAGGGRQEVHAPTTPTRSAATRRTAPRHRRPDLAGRRPAQHQAGDLGTCSHGRSSRLFAALAAFLLAAARRCRAGGAASRLRGERPSTSARRSSRRRRALILDDGAPPATSRRPARP